MQFLERQAEITWDFKNSKNNVITVFLFELWGCAALP